MSVYTKTGDKGETSLYSSDRKKSVRVAKDSLIINVIGSLDELNSFLGIIRSVSEDDIEKDLLTVQENIFTIGAMLAGASFNFSSVETKKLEKQIDFFEAQLPVLKNFILPGGTETAAKLFYARTLARKVERKIVALAKKRQVDDEIIKYLNRLSDYLFILARRVNNERSIEETIWKK